ncbi:alpha/beta hydrolase [Nocardioides eburneiflavus]|uniref:Alpha/beta hydrolase n=1 Tax=Nocardioides eburneiflavus TaxID=2518372 RepID=A0A4Z1CLN4_9ACTN|nr:alpha/beta hydrolase [Nocardioides eburneiflavus]TGN66260.1 alpha/beta hydrolase [Nocardioides eburneiflavus]
MGAPVPFAVAGIVGWVRDADEDRRVLLLHGGPAMSYRYLDGLLDVLTDWSIASFQQRGRDPSTTQGPFDVPTSLADIGHVLDHLARCGWHRPLVAGHSWGGHLAWHVAATLGDQVGGVLAIDPMGAVGDMGMAGFTEELRRRTDDTVLERYDELEAAWASPGLTSAEVIEQGRLLMPAYFADPARAGEVADDWVACHVFDSLVASADALQPWLVAALRAVRVPLGAVHGERSPIPLTATTEAVALVPGAWAEVAEGAGHFVWLEAPDAVRRAMERLRSEVAAR